MTYIRTPSKEKKRLLLNAPVILKIKKINSVINIISKIRER
jgi:hypothetical protein